MQASPTTANPRSGDRDDQPRPQPRFRPGRDHGFFRPGGSAGSHLGRRPAGSRRLLARAIGGGDHGLDPVADDTGNRQPLCVDMEPQHSSAVFVFRGIFAPHPIAGDAGNGAGRGVVLFPAQQHPVAAISAGPDLEPAAPAAVIQWIERAPPNGNRVAA